MHPADDLVNNHWRHIIAPTLQQHVEDRTTPPPLVTARVARVAYGCVEDDGECVTPDGGDDCDMLLGPDQTDDVQRERWMCAMERRARHLRALAYAVPIASAATTVRFEICIATCHLLIGVLGGVTEATADDNNDGTTAADVDVNRAAQALAVARLTTGLDGIGVRVRDRVTGGVDERLVMFDDDMTRRKRAVDEEPHHHLVIIHVSSSDGTADDEEQDGYVSMGKPCSAIWLDVTPTPPPPPPSETMTDAHRFVRALAMVSGALAALVVASRVCGWLRMHR